MHRLLVNKYYVDEIYHYIFVRGGTSLSLALWRIFDVGFIDGIVNGIAQISKVWSEYLRKLQTGFVRQYALTILAGLVLIIAYLVYR